MSLLSELNKRLDEVIQHEPITPKQVEKLSSQLNKYILPQNQTISKRQGLVFYSTDCREGAEVEAERMKDSLEVNAPSAKKMYILHAIDSLWSLVTDLVDVHQKVVDGCIVNEICPSRKSVGAKTTDRGRFTIETGLS